MRTPARSVGSSSRATPWLDNLSRDLLESGAFAELVRDYAVTGATSNPTIFARAILGSDRYDNQLQAAAAAGISNAQALFSSWALRTFGGPRRSCGRSMRPQEEATALRRLSALRIWPTTPRPPSSRH